MKLFKIFLSLIVISWFVIGIQLAQDISVLRVEGKPILLVNELIDKSIRDANGEVCAAIKIVSGFEGFTFDSNNGIVKTSRKPGEDILYLQADEQVITIYKSGYKPLKIVLNEIGIRLESGEVWKIEITGDRKNELLPVNILVNQQDVDIKIDGVTQESKNSTYNILPGKRKLTISKKGYKTINEEILVERGRTYFNYNLQMEVPQVITIKTVPQGATLFIEGKESGKTDLQVFHNAGKYKIKLIKYGYLNLDTEIEVIENNKNEFLFNLQKNVGIVNININPLDAKLHINGREFFPGNIELEPGKHFVEITKDLFESKYDTLYLETGKILNKIYNLEKSTGYLNLVDIPQGASLYINRKNIVYQQNLELLAGNYLVEVEKDGYEKYYEPVIINKGEITTKKIFLHPMFGSLKLTLEPFDAQVKIFRGNNLIESAVGSVYLDSLIVGEYKVETEKNKYISETTFIKILKNQTAESKIALKREAAYDLAINEILANDSDISNLKLEKTGDNYIINYSLEGDAEDEYEVELFLLDRTKSRFSQKLTALSGAIGKGKFSGINRKINWNWAEEYSGGIENSNLYLELRIEKISGGIPWYVWAGGAVAGGVAAILLSNGSKSSGGNTQTTLPLPPSRPNN